VKKSEIIASINESRIMPIYSSEHIETAKQVLRICYEAGLKSFEFTNRVKNAVNIFKDIIADRTSYPGMTIGVGTIMSGYDARSFIDAGADFVISPILNEKVGEVCRQRNVTWIPGSATPTEIIKARDLGADFIKVFPASSYGPSFVSSVLAIAPELKLVVTGGIEPDQPSISAWSKAGAVCIGFGSNLLKKDLIAADQWDSLRSLITSTMSLAKTAYADKK
jgi:2-dehydro-3-deoxyphosphogluconate aldolase/(4S)-4-hydroxy-2-oxoglutarate aldolase